MIPKGEYTENEESLVAAQREFREETGFEPHGDFIALGTVKQTGGKFVTAWAFEGDCDPAKLVSGLPTPVEKSKFRKWIAGPGSR